MFLRFFQNAVFEVETRLDVSEPVFNLHPPFVVGVYLSAYSAIGYQIHRVIVCFCLDFSFATSIGKQEAIALIRKVFETLTARSVNKKFRWFVFFTETCLKTFWKPAIIFLGFARFRV